jgi:acyl-CoA thioesterase
MRDFSLGAGGTLPTQALILTPATFTEQVPHSPFLHFVGTLSPSFWHAYDVANSEKLRQV